MSERINFFKITVAVIVTLVLARVVRAVALTV
jgi:hypothetical protein